MSIVTKTGDEGTTGLATGERVSKAHYRISTYGTLDELVSFMGLARSNIQDQNIVDYIKKIQCMLFLLGTELAKGKKFALPKGCAEIAPSANGICSDHLAYLENLISQYEPRIANQSGFIIPGDSQTSALLDVSRAICRRLERKIVALKEAKEFENSTALKFINRLSDLLYIFARHF